MPLKTPGCEPGLDGLPFSGGFAAGLPLPAAARDAMGLRWNGMSSPRRFAALVAVTTIGLGSGGCTLVKPLVGAITGPVIILGNSDGGCLNGDWCAVGCALATFAAIGAVGGLVTGIASDVRALTEAAADPMDNWWDPFAVNR